jgi:hypothetical protein
MHVYVDCVAIIIFDCHRIITVIPGSSAIAPSQFIIRIYAIASVRYH